MSRTPSSRSNSAFAADRASPRDRPIQAGHPAEAKRVAGLRVREAESKDLRGGGARDKRQQENGRAILRVFAGV